MHQSPHRSAGRRRRAVSLLCAMSFALQWGCYSYQPIQSAPPPVQERVAVMLSDVGRAQLGDRLGPLVERVEGVLVSHDSAGVVLNVTATRDLRGGSSVWSGERVEIPAQAIMGYRPRKLSKSKSLLLGGAVVATIVVLTFGLSLDLFGSDREKTDTSNPPGSGPPISMRIPGIVPLR